MRVLVHICCGPCAITVLQRLLDAGHDPTGLFFNPNIQPLAEHMRRREGAVQVAERLGVPLILADTLPLDEQAWDDPWLAGGAAGGQAPAEDAPLPPATDPLPWLRAVAGRESGRCVFCWRVRLRKSAALALSRGFAAFTSSLLYSRYQKHDCIRQLGFAVAAESGPAFLYEDFRTSWQRGIALSKEWGIYRQQYCGCLFSEYERYTRDFNRIRSEKGE